VETKTRPAPNGRVHATGMTAPALSDTREGRGGQYVQAAVDVAVVPLGVHWVAGQAGGDRVVAGDVDGVVDEAAGVEEEAAADHVLVAGGLVPDGEDPAVPRSRISIDGALVCVDPPTRTPTGRAPL
jgi:hypothetical protein